MNKIFILTVVILISCLSNAQSSTCCASAHNEFALLSADTKFIETHQQPLPFTADDLKGTMITFMATDGNPANAYAIKNEIPSNKYLIVFHEWWGLNDYIKTFSEKFYTDLKNVNVIAVDLYDGKVASTREEAQNYMSNLQSERAFAIVNGLLSTLGENAEIATVGWCMGGGWSLQMAIEAGVNCKAAIMYYGMPEKDMNRIATIACPVLFIHANQDKWINNEVVNTFQQNMESSGKKITVERYDADHAFANPSNPKYNSDAAEDAYSKSLTFINKSL